MKVINRIAEKINKVMEAAALVLLFIILAACFLQVFTRYVLNNSLFGTEEIARFAFVWMSCLGAGICVDKGANASVTVVIDAVKSKRVRLVWNMIINLIICANAMLFIIFGISLITKVAGQYSVSWKIPMQFMYISIPVCGATVLMNSIVLTINQVIEFWKIGKEGDAA